MTKSTLYANKIKLITSLFCLSCAVGCDETNKLTVPDDLSEEEQRVVDYLTETWDQVQYVIKCDSVNVTTEYVNFSLTMTDVGADTKSQIIINYSTINGNLAFPANNGTISFDRTSNFSSDEIIGIRDDNKKIVFRNMNNYLDTNNLLFDLFGTASNCSPSVGRSKVFGGHSVLIKK